MMTTRNLFVAVLSIATSLCAFAEDVKLKVGDDAPALAPKELMQGSLPDLKTEKGCAVVEFWATWCGPCMRSIPHLNQMYKDLGSRGLQLIGVVAIAVAWPLFAVQYDWLAVRWQQPWALALIALAPLVLWRGTVGEEIGRAHV